MIQQAATFKGTEEEAFSLVKVLTNNCCGQRSKSCMATGVCSTVAIGDDQRFLDWALFLRRNADVFFADDALSD